MAILITNLPYTNLIIGINTLDFSIGKKNGCFYSIIIVITIQSNSPNIIVRIILFSSYYFYILFIYFNLST